VVSPSAAKVIAAGAVPGTGVAVAVPGRVGASPPPITVNGCQNVTIANIIKGSYKANGSNHNKPIYQKDGSFGSVAVLIYYWDERDGPNFHGWWFGPKVGGDQVWAYNDNKAAPVPPANGWKVPWDGAVDETVQLQHGNATSPGPTSMTSITGRATYARPGLRPVNSKQLEEVKKREEAQKSQQQKRMEDMKARREAEDVARKENAAAMAVRKAIQRVRTATPDTYDDLRAQLEETQEKNLEAMGSQAEKVSEEATKALEQAQQRIDEMHLKKLQEEQKKQEQERLKKEMEEKVAEFVKTSKDEATEILEKVKAVEELVSQLGSNGTVGAAFLTEAEAAEKQLEEIREGAKTVRSKIIEKQKEVADAESFRKVKREVMETTTKLATASRTIEKSSDKLRQAKQRMTVRAEALEKLAERKKEFTTFDKDKDGKLKMSEMKAYCKSKSLELPQEILDQIMNSLGSITEDKFRPMHQKLFIAHWEVLARRKAEEEAEKQRKIDEEKKALQVILDEINEVLTSCEEIATTAETHTRPLIKDETDKGSEAITKLVEEISDKIEDAELKLHGCGEKYEEAKAALGALLVPCEQASQDLKKLELRESRAKGLLAKISAALKLAREKAKRKAYAEFDQKRTECATAIQAQMKSKEKSADDFFDEINGGNDLERKKFLDFLKDLPGLELMEDQRDQLFDALATEGKISRTDFKELVRVYFKCIKATVMSAEISIKSKTLRRLEVGEVLEALANPCHEEVTRVMRVQCVATQDELVGWVTVAGNQGTTFLEPGGNFYTCIKETVLSDSLELQDSKTLRRIAKGEVIEVLNFPKKDASVDVRRIKGKAKLDGAVGWISLASNQGTVFLEPC